MKDKEMIEEIVKLEILDCADIKLAYLDDIRISKSKPLSLMHNIFTIACKKEYILEALGIPKDSVVLSKEEYECLKSIEKAYDPFWFCSFGGCEGVCKECKDTCEMSIFVKERKETAEKILKDLWSEFEKPVFWADNVAERIKELAKQFGVEIKE